MRLYIAAMAINLSMIAALMVLLELGNVYVVDPTIGFGFDPLLRTAQS
jgi:hypothetical protein